MRKEILVSEEIYVLYKGDEVNALQDSPYITKQDSDEIVENSELILQQFINENEITLDEEFSPEAAVNAILVFLNKEEHLDQTNIKILKRDVEAKKNAFENQYKKFRRNNTMLMVLSLVLLVPLFIFVLPLEGGTWIVLIAVLVIVLGLSALSKSRRRTIEEESRHYMDDYYSLTMEYVYTNLEEVKNYEQLTYAQFDTEDFINARMIKDSASSASRNVVTYDIDGREIAIADFVAYRTHGENRKKRLVPSFIGKLLKVKNNLTDENKRTLIYLKPRIADDTAKGVDDIDGLHTIIDDKEIAIYSTEEDVKKAVNKEVIKLLNDYEIGQHLIDVTISITAGMTYFAFSFSDDLMAVPLVSDIKLQPLIELQKTIRVTNNIIALIK